PQGNTAGLIVRLDRQILELQRYGWTPETLARLQTPAGSAETDEHLLRRKLADLEQIWRTYQELLSDGGWTDPATLPEHAADAIARWSELDGAEVWVDGFASLTAQETR